MSGGGGSDKQETTSQPWAGIQPYLSRGYVEAAQNVLDRPLEFFPGQTYVGYSPETEAALGGITERALAGSPLVDIAQGRSFGMMGAPGTEFLTRTAAGEYTGAENPYLDALTQSISSRVLPQVQSAFGGAGRTGSSPVAQGIMAREMANALAPYQFGEYGRERGLQEAAAGQLAGNQLAAMGLAPELAGIDFTDLARLGQVGAAREAKSMEELQDEMARYQFGQTEPTQRIQQYMSLLGGSAPLIGGTGTQVTRTPSQGNPIFGLLGSALTAAPFIF